MTPASTKTAMTLAAILAGALMLVPQLKDYQAALSALASGLAAWAHGRRPGDVADDEPPTKKDGAP